jgi:DNA topoisomerase I
MSNLVIVESPTKAKTLKKYLGGDYEIKASMGHIRDLPKSSKDIPAKYKKHKWASLGVNVEDDFAPLYLVDPKKKKVITELKSDLKSADRVFLATDPDREGEAISWHLVDELGIKKYERVVFHEITKSAIGHAFEDTRLIDNDLVKAQESRRILDRLVGFSVSPILWSKLKRGLSAGRVQSVAVKVLIEREMERAAFKSSEYFDLSAVFKTDSSFSGSLFSIEGVRVAKGSDFNSKGELKDKKLLWLNKDRAEEIKNNLCQGASFLVDDINEKMQERKPSAPFTTSTLQQECNKKFGYDAKTTMRVAQQLYEEGFITYMRTDSSSLSKEATQTIRNIVSREFGKEFLSKTERVFRSKSKNTQEAHEAIRPSGDFKKPEQLKLDQYQLKIYTLIYNRAIASQMAEARIKFTNADIKAEKGGKELARFKSSGKSVVFAGFLKVYFDEDPDRLLPELELNQSVDLEFMELKEHHTAPPARYTESSLIKFLEEKGIGRPSTYASIISTIQDRGYVFKNNQQLIPTFTGMAVNNILEASFTEYLDYDFTANLEESLDDIAKGELNYLNFLKEFYFGSKDEKGLVKKIESAGKDLNPKEISSIKLPQVDFIVFVGPYGPYVEMKEEKIKLPDETPPADLKKEYVLSLLDSRKSAGNQDIGADQESGKPIQLKSGPYGFYLQIGEDSDKKNLKRVGIPKNIDPHSVDKQKARFLLSLPKSIGDIDSEPVILSTGKFGPYLKHKGKNKSISKDLSIFDVDIEKADKLLKEDPPKTKTLRTSKKKA